MNDRERSPTPTGGIGRKARPRRLARAGAHAPPRDARALCAREARSSGNGASGTRDGKEVSMPCERPPARRKRPEPRPAP